MMKTALEWKEPFYLLSADERSIAFWAVRKRYEIVSKRECSRGEYGDMAEILSIRDLPDESSLGGF